MEGMQHHPLPDGLVTQLCEELTRGCVRPDVVADARRRLTAGVRITAAQIADAILHPDAEPARPYRDLPAAS